MVRVGEAARGCGVFCALVAAGSVACAGQAASWAAVRPFSRGAHRRAVTALARAFLLCGVAVLERHAGVRVVVYGDEVPPDGGAVVVMNHASDVDMLIGVCMLARYGAPFPGNAKAVVKASLGHLPVFGWVLRFAEYLFVTRSWDADRARLLAGLRALRSYPHPVWYVLWPEGSRFTKAKQANSQAYAARKGYPHLLHTLLPRFKAFTALLSVARPSTRSLCDVTLMFSRPPPRALDVLLGRCAGTVVHAHVTSTPLSSLPDTDADLESWLVSRWVEKDARIAAYIADPASLGRPRTEGVFAAGRPLPSIAPFLTLVAAFTVAALAALRAAWHHPRALRALLAAPPVALVAAAAVLAVALRPSQKGLARRAPPPGPPRSKGE